MLTAVQFSVLSCCVYMIFLSIQVQTSSLHSHPLAPEALIQQNLQASMTLKVSGGYPGPSWLGHFGRKRESLEHSPANTDSLGAPGISLTCAPTSDTPRTREAGEMI